MNTNKGQVIKRTRIAVPLTVTAIGFKTPINIDGGVRGKVLGIKARQELGGVVTDLTLYVYDGAAFDGLSVPPLEDLFWTATIAALTASATTGYEDWLVENDGGWFNVRRQADLMLGMNVTAVSAATASDLIIEVWTLVQAVDSGG